MDPELVEALQRRLENKLRASWRAAMREISDSNELAALAADISTGNVGALITGIDDAIDSFTSDIAQGYAYAGTRTTREIDALVDQNVRFDLADERAVAWMRDNARQIADDLIAEQQQVATRVTQLGMRRGLSSMEIADDVKRSIGLGLAQVDQVETYRQVLEGGDYTRALRYELADGRYDASLRRARATGDALDPDRIEDMVDRYRDGWQRSRADNIALNASQEATHAGVDEAFEQAIDDGIVTRAQITQTWVTRDDPKVRPSHRPMHGQTRRLGQPFTSGAGIDLDYPGDPNAPADETAGCRCIVGTDITT